MNKKDWEGSIDVIKDIFAHHNKFPIVGFSDTTKKDKYPLIVTYTTDSYGGFNVKSAPYSVFKYSYWDDRHYGWIWCEFYKERNKLHMIVQRNIYEAAIHTEHILSGKETCKCCTIKTIPWKNIFQNTRK